MSWQALKLLALAAVLLVLTSPAIAEDVLVEPGKDSPSKFWPWGKGKDVPPPPESKPYQLPTMHGDEGHFNDQPPALVKAPAIDAEGLFNSVISCYPERSKFDIDVDLKASASTAGTFNVDDLGDTSLGQNYVQLVARMPLYSSRELDREKDREFRRRTAVASSVSDFVRGIADRNHAIRELSLYRSLEKRSRIRVQDGIVDASEQVRYLEKVASAQDKLVTSETMILDARLKLMAMCSPDKAKTMNTYLRNISAVPK